MATKVAGASAVLPDLGFHCCHGGGNVQGNRWERKQNVNSKLSASSEEGLAGGLQGSGKWMRANKR